MLHSVSMLFATVVETRCADRVSFPAIIFELEFVYGCGFALEMMALIVDKLAVSNSRAAGSPELEQTANREAKDDVAMGHRKLK